MAVPTPKIPWVPMFLFFLIIIITFFICYCFGTEIFMSKIKSIKLLIIDFVSQIVCGNAARARCQAQSLTLNREQGLFYPRYFENEALVLG